MAINNTTDLFNADVNIETSVLFSTLSIASFIMVTFVLLWFMKGDEKYSNVRYDLGLICFTGLVTIVSALSFQNNQHAIYYFYQIIITFVFGVGVTCFGASYFFDIRRSENDIQPIGENTINMSIFVLAITLVLALLELFLFIGALIEKNPLNAVLIVSGLIQKLVQAGLYHFSLRHKIPKPNKYCGASWYLKIIALLNFNLWLESIMIANVQGHEIVENVLEGGYSLFASIYAALMIDYRLLVCIMFIEHAIRVDRHLWDLIKSKGIELSRIASPAWQHESIEIAERFKVDSSQMAGCGYICGMILLASQLVNGLQYTKYLGPWTNVFGITADIFVMLFAALFVKEIWMMSSSKKSDAGVHLGVDTLMVAMGIISLIYWLLKGTMAVLWATRAFNVHDASHEYQYLCWNGIKDCLRPISIIFQIYVFVTADTETACRQTIRKNKRNHFLVPFLMLAFLSVFINAITDVYTGYIEKLADKANLNMVVKVVYKCGEPIHLGFALHMFVHFFIINSKMTAPVFSRKTTISSTLISNSHQHCGDDDKTTPLIKNEYERA